MVGSLLTNDAPRETQWLTGHVADYVLHRLPVAKAEGEAIEEDRLQRNLLSSQPLCFNIFGQFAAYPSAAARVLTRVLDIEVGCVDEVLVEHAPTHAKALLSDRSAFDAYVAFSDGRVRSFLGIETKYTEPFSRRPYRQASYDTATDDPAGWFVPGSAAAASSSATNQLWRTALLAQLTEKALAGSTGYVVVMSTEEDEHAAQAIRQLHPLMREPEVRLRHVTFGHLVEEAAKEPDLRAWASLFAARYLDVPQIAASSSTTRPPNG